MKELWLFITASFNLRFKLEEGHIDLPNTYRPNLGPVPTTDLLRCFLKAKSGCCSQKDLDWMLGRPKPHRSLLSQNVMPQIQPKNPGVKEEQSPGHFLHACCTTLGKWPTYTSVPVIRHWVSQHVVFMTTKLKNVRKMLYKLNANYTTQCLWTACQTYYIGYFI